MASWETLMRQATITTEFYLDAAIRYLDNLHGAGFAVEHPQLVQTYVEACSRDFQTMGLDKTLLETIGVGVNVTVQKG